jgi:hypothetical protein
LKAEEIESWLKTKREKRISETELTELVHSAHPKLSFLKMLGPQSVVMDVGAGDGSLPILFGWPKPSREDLKCYAYSLEKGDRFDDYDGYELSNFDEQKPKFPGIKFNAAFSSHFIEHIEDVSGFIKWITGRLEERSSVYLEWPSENSKNSPTNKEMEALGISFTISNFFDDDTHKDIPDRKVVVEEFKKYGFEVTSQGYVNLPFIEDQVLAHYGQEFLVTKQCSYEVQLAYWSKTNWAQYLAFDRRSFLP